METIMLYIMAAHIKKKKDVSSLKEALLQCSLHKSGGAEREKCFI